MIFGKKYHRYLGVGSGPPFWEAAQWELIRAQMGNLPAVLAEGSAHIRQVDRTTGKDVSTSFSLSADHCDWCGHGDGDRLMTDVQVFWPSRGTCLKRKGLPQVYFHFFKASLSEERSAHDQVFHLAIQDQYYSANQKAADRVLSAIGQILSCDLLAESKSRYSNMNQFESLLVFGLNYRGYDPDHLPDLDQLPGKWRVVKSAEVYEE